MPSVYKRQVSGCQVYYSVLNDKGKVVRRSTGCSDKAEAMRVAAQQQKLLDAGELKAKQTVGVLSHDEAWTLYLQWANKHKLPKTVGHEAMFWKQFWDWQRGTNLCSVTPENAIKWRDYLARTPCRTGKTRSVHSVNDALRAMSTIVARLVKLKHATGNPFSTSETPRLPAPKRRPKYLAPHEVEKVLLIAQHYSTDAYLFTALGLYAGLRKTEILGLHWSDIHADRVDQQGAECGCLYVWEDSTHRLKTAAASRIVPLHPLLKDILAQYRDPDPERFIVRPRHPFVHANGYRWEPRKLFMEMGKELGRVVTPHMLRHSFASLLAMKGVSIYKISKWMGHETVATTEIYAHLCPVDSEIGRL